ncbi:MAG: methylenetetrahydrofolate reductase [NAD(P)H] [Planctomycetota bacterium]|nr:MAG: methylenetetrahydrofolate reductase [NAD(P)H] [Planctomycetota bacterium]
MKISDAYGSEKFGLSFELFPPKTPAGEEQMFSHVARLTEFRPDFITCTYGAGGTTRSKTLEVVQQVHDRFGCSVAAHLTCVGSTVEELRSFLQEASDRGIENIVALRGDPPRGETSFQPVAGGLRYANELVALIRAEFSDFGVAVAGYPETHQEAPSAEIDLENLKRKVDAGADAVITQLFYNNEDFWQFRDACDAAGICTPIVPGILPVTNLAQIKRITSLCGAMLPKDFLSALEGESEAEGQFSVGVDFATRQVQGLVDGGVPGLHFYVLNKSPATSAVIEAVALPRFAA